MSYWQSLSVFNAVVEEGSFSGAAKKLDLTQPTVSFHIDNLEKSFGCHFFNRTPRGVNLTVYGEILLRYTSKIDTQLEEAQNQINAMLAGEAGKITFGASTIPAEYILPSLIAEFSLLNPGMQFSLHTGDSQTILTEFIDGTIPIAIVGVRPEGDFLSVPLWQDEMVLVAHPSFTALLGDQPQLTDLLSQPFVLRRDSSGSMQAVYDAIANIGLNLSKLNVILEVGGNEALKSAVANQLGLGFISKWAVKQELQANKLTILNIPGFDITRQFYAICREPLTPTCFQIFWDFLTSRTSDF